MVSTIEGGIYKFSVDKDIYLGGGFNKYFLFSPLRGEDFQFWLNIFQMDWNHQLVIVFKNMGVVHQMSATVSTKVNKP